MDDPRRRPATTAEVLLRSALIILGGIGGLFVILALLGTVAGRVS